MLEWGAASTSNALVPLPRGGPKVPRILGKPCAVCGFPANGHHYDVPSCQPCASFFQRSVRGGRTYDCAYGGKCATSSESEIITACRSCRYKRCIGAGMSPDSARMSRKPQGNSRASLSPPEIELPSVAPAVFEDRIEKELAYLMVVEAAHERIRMSRHDIRGSLHECSIASVLGGPSLLGTHYGDMPGWPVVLFFEVRCLEDRLKERERIPDMLELLPDNAKNWPVDDVVYGIQYLKTLPFFQELDGADMMILAAATSFGCAIMTSAHYTYRKGECSNVYPDGHRSITDANKASRVYQILHRSLIGRFIELQISKKEYLLVKRIFASSCSAGLSRGGRVILADEQETMAKCLLSVTLATHGVKKGPYRYVQLLDIVNAVNFVVKTHREAFMLLSSLRLIREFGECPLLLSVNKA